MSALQGGHPDDKIAAAPASVPTVSFPPTDDDGRPKQGWQRAVVAGSAAVSVGVLVLGSIGLLFVAAIGVGLELLRLPTPIVWPIVGIAGLAATAACCRLAYSVWRYETDDATDIVL
jgi:predicted cobalt transporter CbtA